MSIEKKINRLASQEDEAMMALIASLPCLGMLQKLMMRKNQGKKPFSPSFEAEKRIRQIQETMEQIQQEEVLPASVILDLQAAAEASLAATAEIKMESLRNDFIWIHDNLLLLCGFIQGESGRR